MDGKLILNRLKKLNEVSCTSEIVPLTYTAFPGKHCPLFGSALTLKGIDDILFVVIGSDECSYYTKEMTLHNDAYGKLDGRCFSVVMNHHDVTFGVKDKLDIAIKELVQEISAKAVCLVTTCVVEVIGDDIDSLCEQYTKQYEIPFFCVHTEHFKSDDHQPGIENTMSACIDLMKPYDKIGGVNILGHRNGSFKTTELYRVLNEQNISINMTFPFACNVEQISKASQSSVNIVVHSGALNLAKAMKEKFGIPYVVFDKMVKPERILNAYKELFSYLKLDFIDSIVQQFNSLKSFESTLDFSGISYIYGNTPLDCFEMTSYFIELGMIPLLLQSTNIENNSYIAKITETHNPYLSKSANIAPLQYVYDELKPDLYFGHEYAERLAKKGIAIVHSDKATSLHGFEVSEFLLKEVEKAIAEAKKYQEEYR